jgi:hypothetical protein
MVAPSAMVLAATPPEKSGPSAFDDAAIGEPPFRNQMREAEKRSRE